MLHSQHLLLIQQAEFHLISFECELMKKVRSVLVGEVKKHAIEAKLFSDFIGHVAAATELNMNKANEIRIL